MAGSLVTQEPWLPEGMRFRRVDSLVHFTLAGPMRPGLGRSGAPSAPASRRFPLQAATPNGASELAKGLECACLLALCAEHPIRGFAPIRGLCTRLEPLGTPRI